MIQRVVEPVGGWNAERSQMTSIWRGDSKAWTRWEGLGKWEVKFGESQKHGLIKGLLTIGFP